MGSQAGFSSLETKSSSFSYRPSNVQSAMDHTVDRGWVCLVSDTNYGKYVYV